MFFPHAHVSKFNVTFFSLLLFIFLLNNTKIIYPHNTGWSRFYSLLCHVFFSLSTSLSLSVLLQFKTHVFWFLVVYIYELTASKTHLHIFYTMVKTMDDSFITIGKYKNRNDELFFFPFRATYYFWYILLSQIQNLIFSCFFFLMHRFLHFFSYIFCKNSLAFCSLSFGSTLFICITFYLSWMKKQRKTFVKFLH